MVIFHQIQHDGGAPGGIFFSDFFTKFSMTGARREGFFFKEGRMTGALENSTKSVENQCVFFCLLE